MNNTLIYYIWHNVNLNNIYDDIKNKHPNKIIILAAEEFNLYLMHNNHHSGDNNTSLINDIEKFLLKYNIEMIIIFGSYTVKNINESYKMFPCVNTKVFFWPSFFIYSTVYYYHLSDNINNFYNKNKDNYSFEKLFISLNNKTQIHRCQLMDKLCECDLLKNGYFSWILTDFNNYDFKYWKQEQLILDACYYKTKEQISNTPDEYKKVLFNLIAETTTEIPFFTEKTIKSIILEQPFLIFGAKDIHKKLTDFGFEKYDEIFDYSFDSFDSDNDRLNAIIDNINNIKDKNYNELHKLIVTKIKHNRQRVFEIVNNKEFIPEIIYSIIEENDTILNKMNILYGKYIYQKFDVIKSNKII